MVRPSGELAGMVRRLISVAGVNLLAKAVAFGAGVWVIRALAPPEYARFANAQAVYSLVVAIVFSAYNFELVRAYGVAVSTNNGGAAATTVLRDFTALTILSYLPLLLVGTLVAEPLAVWLFADASFASPIRWGVWAGAGMVVGNLGLYIQQAREQFAGYNRQNLLRHVLLVPGLWLVFAAGWTTHQATMAVFLLAQLLPSLLYFLHPAQRGLWNWRGLQLRQLRSYLTGLGGLIAYFVFQSLFDQLGIFLLSRYGTAIELAEFGVAQRAYVTLVMLLLSVQAVLLPRFARQQSASDHTNQRRFLLRWIAGTLAAAIPVVGVAWVAQPAWVWLFDGYAWAYQLFLVLLIGAWILLAGTPALSLLVSRQRYTTVATGSLLALMVLGIVAALGMPAYGAWAVAVGTATGIGICYAWFVAVALRST